MIYFNDDPCLVASKVVSKASNIVYLFIFIYFENKILILIRK